MFTGLVQAVGTVVQAHRQPTGMRLLIDAGEWSHSPVSGDSICVSGCCLTVGAERDRSRLAFDLVPETLERTTLGALAPGGRVNLEHPVTPSTCMGGHFVQGHIDGTGVVERVARDGGHVVTVRPPHDLLPFIVPKGSITVDGVSLTLAAVGASTFDIALIPTTLARTTLGTLAHGARVNLETDILAKTVVNYLRLHGTSGSS